MSKRDHWIQVIAGIASAIIAAVLARYGIPVPPMPAAPPSAQVQPDVPPAPLPKAPEEQAADPLGARVKLVCGNAGCTGAVVGPRLKDGRYYVLTAAHCVSQAGQQCRGRMPSGEELALTVQAIDRKADCAWMITQPTPHPIPYIRLSTTVPPVGTRIWVAGYGVGFNGQQRFGHVTGGITREGQLQFSVAVDHGDSGGPVVNDATGELVSVVCCTSALGREGNVYGAGPQAIAAARPMALTSEPAWVPLPLPVRNTP